MSMCAQALFGKASFDDGRRKELTQESNIKRASPMMMNEGCIHVVVCLPTRTSTVMAFNEKDTRCLRSWNEFYETGTGECDHVFTRMP